MVDMIIKPNLIFNGGLTPVNVNNYNSIALHHMAHSTWTIHDVHNYHLGKGWKGIGYGYWVSKEGEIFEGRGLNLNAGVKNKNGNIVSIGFQGDYESDIMPDKQFWAGVKAIRLVKELAPNIKYVDGHCRWSPTSCPGKNFPLQEMIEAKIPRTEVKPHWAEPYRDILKGIGVVFSEKDLDNPLTHGEGMAMLVKVLEAKNIL
jgi:N-acetylmuramoyl-L-alanine amidase